MFTTLHVANSVSHFIIGVTAVMYLHPSYWIYFVMGFLDALMAAGYSRGIQVTTEPRGKSHD
jgi:hypothetical protein